MLYFKTNLWSDLKWSMTQAAIPIRLAAISTFLNIYNIIKLNNP